MQLRRLHFYTQFKASSEHERNRVVFTTYFSSGRASRKANLKLRLIEIAQNFKTDQNSESFGCKSKILLQISKTIIFSSLQSEEG